MKKAITILLVLVSSVAWAALPATAVWEWRADAANGGANGGFFNAARGGTDYSQTDTPVLTIVSDLASDGAGTTLSTATGGVTDAMKGNGIYIQGGGFTAGWYEVVSVTNTNTFVIDRSAGASKSGGAGVIGGPSTPMASAAAMVAGNTAHCEAGTYTLTANITLGNGSADLPITITGYNTARGDNPTGDNRPLLACGAYTFLGGDHSRFNHLRATGTAANVLRGDLVSVFRNCRSENTSGTAGRFAFNTNSYGAVFIGCEGVSSAGSGFSFANSDGMAVGCYAHDSGQSGFVITGDGITILRSIADTCTTAGVTVSTGDYVYLIGLTAYGNGIGIDLGARKGVVALNCLIDTNTTGISATDGYDGSNWVNYCNFNGNGTARRNVPVGPNDTAVDPSFTDAAGGNFTATAAGIKAVAFPGVMPGATSTTNYEDLGGVQTEATGSGGTRTYGGGGL